MAANVNVSGANPPSNSGSKNNPPKAKLCCFGYVDYIVLASTLAIALGDELDVEDLSILSTFFAVLSDELALIGAVQACPSNNSHDEVFVPPVPDVAVTTTGNKTKKSAPHKKTRIKKIIRKKVKKK